MPHTCKYVIKLFDVMRLTSIQFLFMSNNNKSLPRTEAAYLLADMWKRMTWLPCWLPRGQQVLHQR